MLTIVDTLKLYLRQALLLDTLIWPKVFHHAVSAIPPSAPQFEPQLNYLAVKNSVDVCKEEYR
jgi:hypothetical protein